MIFINVIEACDKVCGCLFVNVRETDNLYSYQSFELVETQLPYELRIYAGFAEA